MAFIIAIIFVGAGLAVDAMSSHKTPWVFRKLTPPLCYGLGLGFLIAAMMHGFRH